VPGPELTVKDRIQLHLFDFNKYAEAFEAPVEVTQEAIANAVGIRVHHVPQYIRPLIADALVDEGTSHIQKQKRRRKVYFLSAKGRAQVASLRNSLLQETIPLRRRGGDIEQVPLSRIYHEDRRGASLSELVNELRSLGYLLEIPEVAKPGIVDFSQEAPTVERFYGREREFAQVTHALETLSLVVVTGMAGIGKTTFGGKVCESFRGKRSLFWRQVRPWDTASDLGTRLATFLRAMGRTELHSLLVGRGTKDLSSLEEPLAADLAGTSALIVFDDTQNASHEALMFLSLLQRALRRQKGTSGLILSRNVPPFYSRREVAVDGSIVEFALSGLDAESSELILADSGLAPSLRGGLVEASGGNPLFLRLLASAGPPEEGAQALRTVETYIAEEIEPALAEAERSCLQLAAFYEIPVPPRGLLRESAVDAKTLVALQRKGLLTEVGKDRFVVHESLRMYFREGLAAERRERFVAHAVPWLLEEADTCVSGGRPLDAIAYLGNALTIEVSPNRKLSMFERIGDLRRLAGDLQGSVESFRMALRTSDDPRARARFHQKIAIVLGLLGELQEAEREVEAGLDLLPTEPSLERAWLLVRRAGIAELRTDYEVLAANVELVLSWMPVLSPDNELWATVANLRGLLHLMDSKRLDFSLAKADFEQAIGAFQVAGDSRGLCSAHNNRGLAYLHLGEIKNALADFEIGCKIADAAGSLPGRELALFSKAFCCVHYLGDFDEAEKLYEETYRINKLIRRRHKLLWHAKYFADLYRFQGRYEEARESLAHFLAKSQDLFGPATRADYLSLMVRLCVRCNDLDAAETYLLEALDSAGEVDLAKPRHYVEWARGVLIASRGDMSRAAATFEEAFRLAPEFDRGEFLVEYGQFLASTGLVSKAKEVLTLACKGFERDPRKPLEDEARRTLLSLESAVPV